MYSKTASLHIPASVIYDMIMIMMNGTGNVIKGDIRFTKRLFGVNFRHHLLHARYSEATDSGPCENLSPALAGWSLYLSSDDVWLQGSHR